MPLWRKDYFDLDDILIDEETLLDLSLTKSRNLLKHRLSYTLYPQVFEPQRKWTVCAEVGQII